MAYETYTTEALVCGSYAVREHDQTLQLFTKEGGMLYARAGGTRANVSKLRYALQNFSYVRVTLVRGKSDWRVIGAVSYDNFYFKAITREARARVLFSVRHLSRLIQGALKNQELFSMVIEGVKTLATHDLEGSEKVFLLRLLDHLGYVREEKYAALLNAPTLEEATNAQVPDYAHLEVLIEHALQISQL